MNMCSYFADATLVKSRERKKWGRFPDLPHFFACVTIESVPASIQQINISKGGVPKLPIPVAEVTPLGIRGDAHAHPQIHGGPRQAVLLITAEGLEELIQAGFPLYPGALGENITTVGLNRREMRLGQRYRMGSVVIELTKMREPCNTLTPYGAGIQQAVYDAQVKAQDPSSPRWALAGIYASIIQPGTVRPGDPITLLDQAV
jgi:MOSC domain-containing protein YiiM